MFFKMTPFILINILTLLELFVDKENHHVEGCLHAYKLKFHHSFIMADKSNSEVRTVLSNLFNGYQHTI